MVEVLKKNSILVIILVLAFFLRVFGLSFNPPELFGDELDVGYQAYSILKTGRDLQGFFLPTYFQSLAEARAPLFLYSAVPFVAIFGLNEWGVRLTAAFWGILSIFGIYLLTKKLFKSEFLSLVSCFFLAISPWHLQYSRAGFEVTLLLSLLIFATYFFLKGFENSKFFAPSAFFFALTFYTYSTANVFTPLLLISLVLIFWKEINKVLKDKIFLLSIFLFILILIPAFGNLITGAAAERFGVISLFKRQEIVQEITQNQIAEPQLGRLFHNKGLSFGYEIARNYLWAFSPQFLFFDGDPVGRHHIGKMGEFSWFALPLLIFGIFGLKKLPISQKPKFLIIAWLLLAPIPSSLTIDGAYHATRLFILIVPLILISAAGTTYLFENLNKQVFKTAFLVIVLVGLVNLATYFHQYWVHYPKDSWRWWQIGFKEGMGFIAANQNNFEKILINNTYEPALIRFLFYTKYEPAKFHQNFSGDQPKKQILSGFDGFSLENKFFFGTKTVEFPKILDSKTLYLVSQRDEVPGDLDYRAEPPANVKVLKTVTNPFGEPIFYLLTGTKNQPR